MFSSSTSCAVWYAKNLSYTYANTGVKGRYTGFSLDNISNSVYSYDSYGRLNQIDGLGGSFTYGRLADSGLIENLIRPNGVNTQWAYEAHRNLVTQVTKKIGAIRRKLVPLKIGKIGAIQ